ncbi:hypothetical protein KKI23_00280 [Patescibacteria group bacterium]|nr:hypothetical protein [Patescibacteria group bacterium]
MGKEALKTMVTLATTAFGLVAALAWNGAITGLFNKLFGERSNLISLFVYAVIVTIVAVLVTSKLGKLAEKVGANPEPKK